MSTNLGDEAQCVGGGGQGALSAFSWHVCNVYFYKSVAFNFWCLGLIFRFSQN
jgi:hypothetical protein